MAGDLYLPPRVERRVIGARKANRQCPRLRLGHDFAGEQVLGRVVQGQVGSRLNAVRIVHIERVSTVDIPSDETQLNSRIGNGRHKGYRPFCVLREVAFGSLRVVERQRLVAYLHLAVVCLEAIDIHYRSRIDRHHRLKRLVANAERECRERDIATKRSIGSDIRREREGIIALEQGAVAQRQNDLSLPCLHLRLRKDFSVAQQQKRIECGNRLLRQRYGQLRESKRIKHSRGRQGDVQQRGMKQITRKRRLLLRQSQHGRTYLHGLGQVLAHRGMPTGFGVVRRYGIWVEDNGQSAVRRRRAHLTGSCGAVSSICHPEEVAGSVATGIDSELGLGAIVRRTIIHSEIGKVHLDDMSRGGRKERGSLVALLGIVVAAICGGNGVGELPVAQHLDSLATAFGIGGVLDSQ